jgi:hypothetical protein
MKYELHAILGALLGRSCVLCRGLARTRHAGFELAAPTLQLSLPFLRTMFRKLPRGTLDTPQSGVCAIDGGQGAASSLSV